MNGSADALRQRYELTAAQLQALSNQVNQLQQQINAANQALARQAQINQQLAYGLSAGVVEVQVGTVTGEMTPPISVEFYEPQPIIPRIVNVRNERDEEAVSLKSGHNSEIRLFVEGMDSTADPSNTRIKIGQSIIKPLHIEYVPANAAYLVKALLPANIEHGQQELKLYVGNLVSPAWIIEVK